MNTQNIQLFKFFDQLTKSALFQNFALYWELKPEAKVLKKFWKPTWNLAWSQRSSMSQWDKAWHIMAMSVPWIFFMEKVLFCNLVTNSYLMKVWISMKKFLVLYVFIFILIAYFLSLSSEMRLSSATLRSKVLLPTDEEHVCQVFGSIVLYFGFLS